MKLPNAERVEIEQKKIVEYLLSETHEEGRPKAEFFLRMGFSVGRWQELADVLRKHAVTYEVVEQIEFRHGTLYTVEGEINTPSGKRPRIRSVWIVGGGATAPRLVSAYRIRESK